MARGDTRSLAGGAVVETRLCARLLGVRLLVIDGAVTLWPAQPEPPAPGSVMPAQWADPPAALLPPAARPESAGPAPDEVLGSRLEATARRLEASSRRLQELQTASTAG